MVAYVGNEIRARRVILVGESGRHVTAWCEALRHQGLDPLYTGDGEKALWMIAEMRPCCVVLDLDLPREDALMIAGALRAHPRTAHLAIVALSRSSSADIRELVLARGCDRVLEKPIRGELLAAEIEAIVAAAERRRARAA